MAETEHAHGLEAFGIDDHDARLLLDLAESSIRARLAGRPAPEIDTTSLSPPLRRTNGAFVTLHVDGQLNGCIGDITGTGALATSVAELAIKAAFGDPRLPALRPDDLDRLNIEISLLTEPVEIPARSRRELFEHLRPGHDGLILRSGWHQALFLPSVWRQLPEPDRFVDHLLLKAGLPQSTWPRDLVAFVFSTAAIDRDVRG